MVSKFIVFGSLIFPALGRALPCAPGGAFIDNLREVGVKPLGVVIVDDAERKDAKNYGLDHHMTKEAVEAQYAATGDILCPAGKVVFQGEGQVTVKNDVVVSVAHVFFDDDTCKTAVPPERCTFTIKVAGKSQKYGIERMMDTGWPCPFKGTRPAGSDWIVLKLKKPVDARVKPYAIPNSPKSIIEPNKNVVAVAKSADWPPGDRSERIATRPRHYGDCRTRFVERVAGSTGQIETDCDLTQGASGGSMLTPGPDPTLVAVLFGERDIKRNSPGCDPSLGKSGRDTYHPHCWANFALPVAGELWTAIAAATNFTGKPEAEPTLSPREPRPSARPPPVSPSPDPESSGPHQRHDIPGGGYYRNF